MSAQPLSPRPDDGLRRALTLTTEQALAWFGEPRYSVTDLQRAYAEGAAAVIDADTLRCGQCGDDLLPEHIEGHLNSEGRTLLAATPPAAVLGGLDDTGPTGEPVYRPPARRWDDHIAAALPAGSGAGELDARTPPEPQVRPSNFGDYIDFGVGGAIVVATNDGAGYEPCLYLLSHQLYVTRVRELQAAHREVWVLPVNSYRGWIKVPDVRLVRLRERAATGSGE